MEVETDKVQFMLRQAADAAIYETAFGIIREIINESSRSHSSARIEKIKATLDIVDDYKRAAQRIDDNGTKIYDIYAKAQSAPDPQDAA
jgi:hypothetical protein